MVKCFNILFEQSFRKNLIKKSWKNQSSEKFNMKIQMPTPIWRSIGTNQRNNFSEIKYMVRVPRYMDKHQMPQA